MSQIMFGAGNMYVTQLQDAFGNTPTTPQPYPLLVMQEASIDDTAQLKKLFGQNARAYAIARGETTTTLKVKFARVLANVWNAIYFGQTLTNGLLSVVTDTTGAAIPTTPYQITPTPPSSGIYKADLGVISGVTGKPITRVASGPTTGQYSVNEATGVYTFAAADTGLLMYINYEYNVSTAGSGFTQTVRNLPMGAAPLFRARLNVTFQGKGVTLDCRSCVATKLTLPFKNTDFAVPELDFELQDDGAGNVYDWSTVE